MDIVGCLILLEYGDIFNYFVKKYFNIIFFVYCYNDLGLVIVNILVVILNGVK